MSTVSRNEIFQLMDILLSESIKTSPTGRTMPCYSNVWNDHMDQTFLALKEEMGWTWQDRAELSKAYSDVLDQMEKELMGSFDHIL